MTFVDFEFVVVIPKFIFPYVVLLYDENFQT